MAGKFGNNISNQIDRKHAETIFSTQVTACCPANAVGAIGSIGSMGRGSLVKSTIPQILPLFGDADANVRLSAIIAISNMGSSAKSAIPQILTLFQDPDRKVRVAVVTALGLMEKSDRTVVSQTRAALKKLGYKK